MKVILIASLLVLLVCPQVLCKTPKTQQDVQRILLRTIAKKKITEPEAICRLLHIPYADPLIGQMRTIRQQFWWTEKAPK